MFTVSIDPADVTPSLLNWITVGLLAVSFILFTKFVFGKLYIPGVSEAFASI